MIDSEDIPDNFKTLKISIVTKIKNPETIKFIKDYLKTKRMCKNSLKK